MGYDELDREEFDPYSFLESCVGDASRLTLDNVHNEMLEITRCTQLDIKTLLSKISNLVKEPELEGWQKGLDRTATTLQAQNIELSECCKSIQHEAQSVANDLLPYVSAKKNLVHSIQLLQEWIKLREGVGALRFALNCHNGEEICTFAILCEETSKSLDYASSPAKLKCLLDEYRGLRPYIDTFACSTFGKCIEGPSLESHSTLQELRTVITMVSTLDSSCLPIIIAQFVNSQVAKQAADLSRTKQLSSIFTLERHYAWIRKFFADYQRKFSDLFPASWRLPERVLNEVLQEIREVALSALTPENISRPDILKRVYSKAKTFELEVEKWLMENTFPSRFKEEYVAIGKYNETHIPDCPNLPNISGFLTDIFEGYLQGLISDAKYKFEEHFAEISASKEIAEKSDPSSGCLSFALDTFNLINVQLQSLVKLSDSHVLTSLASIWENAIVQCSNIMRDNLLGSTERRSLRNWVVIMNTSSECRNLTFALCKKLEKFTIDIDRTFSNAQKSLNEVLDRGIEHVLVLLDATLAHALRMFRQQNWNRVAFPECVPQGTSYIDLLMVEVNKLLEQIRTCNLTLFTKVCHVFVERMFVLLRESLLKVKRVSSDGAMQIRIDLQSLLNKLGDLFQNHLAYRKDTLETNSETKTQLARKEFAALDILLKLATVPSTEILSLYAFANENSQITLPEFITLLKMRGFCELDREDILRRLISDNSGNSMPD